MRKFKTKKRTPFTRFFRSFLCWELLLSGSVTRWLSGSVTCKKIFYRHSGGEADAQITAAVRADAQIIAAVRADANAPEAAKLARR
jgi:hypothetical protein